MSKYETENKTPEEMVKELDTKIKEHEEKIKKAMAETKPMRDELKEINKKVLNFLENHYHLEDRVTLIASVIEHINPHLRKELVTLALKTIEMSEKIEMNPKMNLMNLKKELEEATKTGKKSYNVC